MAANCPPITFALPGPVTAVVTPCSLASLNEKSSGFMASIAKAGSYRAVASLPSDPSNPIHLQTSLWEWASINPGITHMPSASITSTLSLVLYSLKSV